MCRFGWVLWPIHEIFRVAIRQFLVSLLVRIRRVHNGSHSQAPRPGRIIWVLTSGEGAGIDRRTVRHQSMVLQRIHTTRVDLGRRPFPSRLTIPAKSGTVPAWPRGPGSAAEPQLHRAADGIRRHRIAEPARAQHHNIRIRLSAAGCALLPRRRGASKPSASRIGGRARAELIAPVPSRAPARARGGTSCRDQPAPLGPAGVRTLMRTRRLAPRRRRPPTPARS